MDYIYASILGLVQGVTEFVPISSSGHLVLLHRVLPLTIASDLMFDVALHSGTLLAIIIFFRKDIIQYFCQSPKFIGLILLSALPAGVIGFLFENAIDYYLRSSWVVVIMLVFISILFFIVEARFQPRLSFVYIRWWHALLLGSVQALALIPGTSRSGITMATGMALGLPRPEAARFSFLMIIPLLLGLTAKQSLDIFTGHVSAADLGVMAVGAIVAAMVGLMVIRYLLIFLQRYTLKAFAWYRLGLAAVVSLMLLL